MPPTEYAGAESINEEQPAEDLDAGSIFKIPDTGGPARRRSARLSVLPPSEMKFFGSSPKPPANIASTSPRRKRGRESASNPTASRRARVSSGSSSDMGEDDTRTSPTAMRTKREKKRTRLESAASDTDSLQRAASLSPSSTQILTALWTPSHPPHFEDNIGKSDAALADFSPAAPLASTVPDLSQIQRPPPGKSQTLFMSPARGTLRHPPFQPSPMRMTFSFASDPANRTPARRVPFPDSQTPSQASTGGHFSKFKLNTPTFTRPARKIDMSPQRIAVPRSQPSVTGKVFSKGKEKEIFSFPPPKTDEPDDVLRPFAFRFDNSASLDQEAGLPKGSPQQVEYEGGAGATAPKTPMRADAPVATRLGTAAEQILTETPGTNPDDTSVHVRPPSSQPSGSLQSSLKYATVPSLDVKSKIPRVGALPKAISLLPVKRSSKLPMPSSRHRSNTAVSQPVC